MPEIVTRENAADNRTCSKCRRRQYAFKFITDGRIFKTCNACREKAWLRTHPISLWVNDAVRTYTPQDESDTDNEGVTIAVSNLASSSSSSAAAASSSVDYFVEEPEPEPEPDD
jgi:hypothetical protein